METDILFRDPFGLLSSKKRKKEFIMKELLVVPQIDQFDTFKEFAEALSLADEVGLAPIDAARETDTLGISSDTLRQNIAHLGTDAYYLPTFGQIEDFLRSHIVKDDLVITMGAGDVVNIGEELLAADR